MPLIFYFSYYTSADLVKAATKVRDVTRGIRTLCNQDDRIDQFIACEDNQNRLDKEDERLCKEMYGSKLPWKFYGPNKDQLALAASYCRLAESKVFKPHSFHIFEHTCGDAPLLDFIVADHIANFGGHAVPSKNFLEDIQNRRCVSNSTLGSGHVVKTLTIGLSSPDDIEEAILYFNAHFSDENAKCPVGVTSLNVDYIDILESDYHKLPGSGLTSLDRTVLTRKPRNDESASQIPAVVTIGGLKWTLTLRFDIIKGVSENDEICYVLKNTMIHDKL